VKARRWLAGVTAGAVALALTTLCCDVNVPLGVRPDAAAADAQGDATDAQADATDATSDAAGAGG
jgi:hypothetical protein